MADLGFVTCSLRCRQCATPLASINTMAQRIPRGKLAHMARARGATTTESGDWFCSPRCRTLFTMTHNLKPKDLP